MAAQLPHPEESRITLLLREVEPKKEHVLTILRLIQDNEPYHYIPAEAVRDVANYLHMTPSEVVGIISFYSMFSCTPRGKYIIRVCTSASCHVMDARIVVESLEQMLGITVGETTKDHLFTLEASSCLGLCDKAPAMMVNDEIHGNLTLERIKEIIGEKS